MNKELQIFNNAEFGTVRTMEVEGKPYFCGTDVAKALGYGSNPQDAIRRHCLEDGCVNHAVTDSIGREQQAKFISEGNMYRLISHSKLPSAQRFESWVFDEVLPSIRRHGLYAADELLNNPDLFISALQELKAERARVQNLEEEVAQTRQIICEMQPKVSYYDTILQNQDVVPVSLIAKDYGMSGRSFNAMLHELGVQFKQHHTWLLYQKYANQGYTFSRTQEVNEGRKTVMHTYWTQKGRLFLYDLLKNKRNLLPMIERDMCA